MKRLKDKIEGYLEIGINERYEVVMNLDKDRNGIGHIVFSPRQALGLATILRKKAVTAEAGYLAACEAAKRRKR